MWRRANGRALHLGDIAVPKFGIAVADSQRDSQISAHNSSFTMPYLVRLTKTLIPPSPTSLTRDQKAGFLNASRSLPIVFHRMLGEYLTTVLAPEIVSPQIVFSSSCSQVFPCEFARECVGECQCNGLQDERSGKCDRSA